ncbi:efflux RND transporter periplasmic adaptor subunit [Paracoccus marinaquae]|uniref:Efflux RND transporter periplasmic adaptor subunit n=1 Tax=Paracoccus marinaquae TaxID=2841926 RepID=A0ABS6ADX9_9RHOB|nr:efflux RND transporter periplasmic adaptor subunit [Paracoccus marinaquae]MBU3028684.1 efflux RND transporter periplasmic adaptor subunit [Paracoccus marinaquae]
MRSILTTLLAVALLTLPARAEEAPAPGVAGSVPTVTVVAAVKAEVQAQVPVTGTLVARRPVEVFAKVSGFEIIELLAEPGDAVEEGQVLARLSVDTLAAQLAQAEAEYQRARAGVGQAQSNIDSAEALLTQAEIALKRAEQLRQGGNTPQATLDQAIAAAANARATAASASDGLAVATAALALAEAARRIASLDMDRAEITAPVAGLVTARNAELGALSGASAQPLFAMIAGGEIELEAEVIETALPDLKAGDPVEVHVAGVGAVQGRVRLVPAAVDPATRLGLMRISLGEASGLRIGLFASGQVVTGRHEAVMVPAAAVLSDAEGDRVQVVRDGRIETREITAGLLWQGRREIVAGLAEGEVVVARAGAFFRDGDPVRPVPSAKEEGGLQTGTAATGATASAGVAADGARKP